MDILITEEISSPAFDALAARYSVHADGGLWRDEERLKAAIAGARAVIVRNQTQLGAEVLAAAASLKVIGRCGVGLDNIDVHAATERGVVVIAPMGANAVSVAEFAMGLLLAVARKIAYGDRSTKAGIWDRKGCTGIELDGKTMAVCGFGRIGRLVAARARAFGMRIVVFDPYVKAGAPELREAGAELASTLEEALGVADVVSVHSALTEETRHLFNARTLGATKRGALLINASRGGVVDEVALAAALESGHLGGAGLDVREIEPPAHRAALEAMDNVVLTPHCAAFTTEAQARTLQAVADDVERVLRGDPAVNYVNFASGRRRD